MTETDAGTETAAFPLEGGVYRVDYGDMVLEQDYTVPGKITGTIVEGPHAGFSSTSEITATRVRDDVYVVAFQDEAATVVLVADLASHGVTTTLVLNDRTVLHLRGRISPR
jgi:molybdenum cofactor biosynthesis MoaF-like protein